MLFDAAICLDHYRLSIAYSRGRGLGQGGVGEIFRRRRDRRCRDFSAAEIATAILAHSTCNVLDFSTAHCRSRGLTVAR